MSTAWGGRPVRDAVCLVACRGRSPTACVPCPRAVTAPDTPIALAHGGLGRVYHGPNAVGVPQWQLHSVRLERPRQAASVGGLSNQESMEMLGISDELR